jgi:hypothetical protein
MNERIMTRGFPWGEPAHPAIVKQYEDLVAIYRVIRKELQQGIDLAFDRVSREIGFVVTTTLSIGFEITADHSASHWTIPDQLKGSLFEKAMLEAVGRGTPDHWKEVSPGRYQLLLVWYEALKLRLRKDWLEPVHYLSADIAERISEAARVRPEVQEPAHWFLPTATIPVEEKILISAIDEVYPELRLAERIATTRQLLRQLQPEVMERLQVRPGYSAELALREITQLFKRVRPDIQEPAHFRLAERDILAEIEAVVRKYGV